ncbi:MAG: prephenate dehydrogenase/arogenate dehydrogenase family protein, partial [Bacteroidia bacterium]|nr:prephenate dehydrogenase/arogenate dehydrogenase family protein [Bacteroidia bacterium]
MKICIVGLGLLGGSFALGLKEKLKYARILGVDIHPEHQQMAQALGLVDELVSLEEGIAQAALTVLAIPVNAILDQICPALDLLPENAVLTDLGSTKALIGRVVDQHPKRGRYVALHPIAGTENSGPEAAFAGLLKNKIMIVC